MSLTSSTDLFQTPSLFAFAETSTKLNGGEEARAVTRPSKHLAIVEAAQSLLASLEAGETIDGRVLRAAMQAAFGGSDAEGSWVWKDAYEAVETAQVLFVLKYGAVMQRQARYRAKDDAQETARIFLQMLEAVANLCPTQTRRSEESETCQQFSTPLPLAFVAAQAAGITGNDTVLEPSAGTGMMAVFARTAGASLILNEYSELRAKLLKATFGVDRITRFDAAAIHDRLNDNLTPSLVLMNPPFSSAPGVAKRMKGTTARHVRSALQRLQPNGRLVAITGECFRPDHPAWREAFRDLQSIGRVVFSAGIAGKVFAPHGTTIETRLTVIDKRRAEDPAQFDGLQQQADSASDLLAMVQAFCPPRLLDVGGSCAARPASPSPSADQGRFEPDASGQPPRWSTTHSSSGAPSQPATARNKATRSPSQSKTAIALDDRDIIDIAYHRRDWSPTADQLTASLYEAYEVQSITIESAKPHPTTLVQSAAMASVAPPLPSYRPKLPAHLVRDGLLSDAQIESVVYAGEAHSGFLSGSWKRDAETGELVAAGEGEGAKIRRGWFLGDGTGCGKGRQVAGIIMDNWLKGRHKAVWLSKSDKLIEDARRDWTALGGSASDIVALSKFKQGAEIAMTSGILFVTYATLRTAERTIGSVIKKSRLAQLIEWLGEDFDGVIAFDEAHAMANASGGKSERGDKKPSQQGKAGLDLQNTVPGARVVYVSATGATEVSNLAYASRLGLWGTGDFPFVTRASFVSAMEAGGIAAMEVISRDLKALGLYIARSVSYAGVEYDMLVHDLSQSQIAIYDSYAEAFQVIHNHLDAALLASGVTSDEGTLNPQAKSAARSAFESNKQRFFQHLISAMKCPSLIPAIEADLEAGHSAVVQIVSTSEALLERRLAEIPASEWHDIQLDVTPREYVLDYLQHSFPVQLFEPFTDEDGNLHSRPAMDEAGNPVLCREAVARRDAMIEKLGSLAPVQGALDQLIWRFGTDAVAEVTGRSRRVVRTKDGKLKVEKRPASSNIAETQSFMDDDKRILIFSDAGGTGRSYHADCGAKNQRLRVHYLLEPGWRADNAIQGLGRTHRTNQAQPPLFRPVATNVKGEKRFLSTIARRLDTLGAITRGQRQTGGQGMFRAEDNLESPYARAALRRFFAAIHAGRIEACSLERFETMTGLELTGEDGTLREDLPPIQRFLNRCLALTIEMQNAVFEAFTGILSDIVEAAIAGGTYDIGLETLKAERFTVTDRQVIYEDASGAMTTALTIEAVHRNTPMRVDEAMKLSLSESRSRYLVNEQSGRAAVEVPASALMDDDGGIVKRVRLVRPMGSESMTQIEMEASHWTPVAREAFRAAWEAETIAIPEFSTSTLTIISGLLLPIWDRLPDENCRVYRLQTDTGERVIGRMVTTDQLGTVFDNLGLSDSAKVALTPEEIEKAVMQRGTSIPLLGEMALRRSRVMNVNRMEVTGFDPAHLPLLKSLGCMTEIIQWKTRVFVPVGDRAPLERVLERFPQKGVQTSLDGLAHAA
ncbi:strawberry notch family protein [Fulvimarina sp. 2208YS6-2-32]|uniref:Strawberry notch family protein n=1 Tax=Fulvimarina uroteuthidis TaxID=3098149 RepID=A0ABU5I744_9HYPH|nr:strawberry notch family protein [Fulvimarina sp. 2208YS6-2-32]MDY8110907.1 strawberry notch family protein [Fulvimarina sp. 2208YS6-2-32]